MNESTILAKDKIRGCTYVVTISGKLLTVTMSGYGLVAKDTQKVTRVGSEFNYDAALLAEKMVTLERRMRDLARITTQLKANEVTGVPTFTE